jgi:hypothetical protein
VKVSEYASEVINSRPYKYQTRLTYLKDLKRLGIWDLDVSEINSALIRDIVEKVTTQSTRKRLFITARSIFKDLGICQDLPNLEADGILNSDLRKFLSTPGDNYAFREKYEFLAIYMRTEITFRDSHGINWKRKMNGKLKRV